MRRRNNNVNGGNNNAFLPTHKDVKQSAYDFDDSSSSPYDLGKKRRAPWWRTPCCGFVLLLVVALTLTLMILVSRFQTRHHRNVLNRTRRRHDERRERRREKHERRTTPQKSEATRQLADRISETNRQLGEVSHRVDEHRRRMTASNKEKARLMTELEQAKTDHMSNGNGNGNGGETKLVLSKLKRQEDELFSRMELLQRRVQRESHRAVLATYGPKPRRVRFSVRLPGDPPSSDPKNFTVETFSVDAVPHSVHFFLEQVRHGLWDGSSFNVNAYHILQSAVPNLASFRRAELDRLGFQEYSPDFPHAKYTLGLAGRPPGPEFYINKVDNSLNHGPGGQNQHVLGEEGEPCFAKIVDGFDVVDDMGRLPASGSLNLLQKTVTIVKAEILPSDDGDGASDNTSDAREHDPADLPKQTPNEVEVMRNMV